jgi:anti-sigma B factor antagonist
MDLKLTTKSHAGTLTITLNGELNTQTTPELIAVFDEKLSETDVLYLDFAGCDLVASAGLRALLNAYKMMKAKKGTVRFINIGPNFSEVLNITGLDTVFGIK